MYMQNNLFEVRLIVQIHESIKLPFAYCPDIRSLAVRSCRNKLECSPKGVCYCTALQVYQYIRVGLYKSIKHAVSSRQWQRSMLLLTYQKIVMQEYFKVSSYWVGYRGFLFDNDIALSLGVSYTAVLQDNLTLWGLINRSLLECGPI